MEENFWGAVRFCRLSFDLKSPVVRLESTVAADLIQSLVIAGQGLLFASKMQTLDLKGTDFSPSGDAHFQFGQQCIAIQTPSDGVLHSLFI